MSKVGWIGNMATMNSMIAVSQLAPDAHRFAYGNPRHLGAPELSLTTAGMTILMGIYCA